MTHRTEIVREEVFNAAFRQNLGGSFGYIESYAPVLCFYYYGTEGQHYFVPDLTDDEILAIIMSEDPHKIIRSWELVVIDYSYMA